MKIKILSILVGLGLLHPPAKAIGSNLNTVMSCASLENDSGSVTTFFVKQRVVAEQVETYILANQSLGIEFLSTGQRPVHFVATASLHTFENPLFEIDISLEELSRVEAQSLQKMTGSFADYISGKK